jgi:hypothetical protein
MHTTYASQHASSVSREAALSARWQGEPYPLGRSDKPAPDFRPNYDRARQRLKLAANRLE